MPQLVLLDIWLPGMDGLETLKAIKNAHPKVLVIICPAHEHNRNSSESYETRSFLIL